MTLDKVIDNNNWPLPDLIKIDAQGSELDILEGGSKILSNAKYLIVELQHIEYNDNAPLFEESIDIIENAGWKLINSKFSSSDYSIDADYLLKEFKNYRLGILLMNYDMSNHIICTISSFEFLTFLIHQN